MSVSTQPFGKLANGEDVFLYRIENNRGNWITITNFGCIITTINIADKSNKIENVVLGFDNLESYLKGHPYFGALCGRYANRIRNAEITINGKTFILSKNDDNNLLHGGKIGFDKKLWNSAINRNNDGVNFNYTSKDGEEGFPGNLKTQFGIVFNDNNEVILEYSAETDQDTCVNLTHHDYFNLTSCKRDIKSHMLEINASFITETDEQTLPTGNYLGIKNSFYDFTSVRAVGKDIAHVGIGYDDNFIINKNETDDVVFAARLTEPDSGRVLEVYTSQPGVHLYTGNYLDGSLTGPQGIIYAMHYGLCLETQHFADSPNQPHFPSTLLKPGEKYVQKTIYKFS